MVCPTTLLLDEDEDDEDASCWVEIGLFTVDDDDDDVVVVVGTGVI